MGETSDVETAIRQLYARYVDAVWRRDVEAFVACFAADAEWNIAGRRLRGHDEIGSGFLAFMAPAERVMMQLGPPAIDVGAPTTATGRTLVSELIKLLDGRAMRTIGVYYDRFVRQGGHWRFGWRHWSLTYYGPPDFSGAYYDSPDFGPPPAMPPRDEPTLVRRDA
jgi:uncharacterized protein (TIGR02246 family)